MTKLGRLVKARIINTIEEIYLHSIPIKEYQIVDLLLPGKRSLSPFALCFFEVGCSPGVDWLCRLFWCHAPCVS